MPAYRQLQTIALPIILANLATPLVGFVDVAVIGQLGRGPSAGRTCASINGL